MARTIYTVGHSTRSLEELVALLEENGIARLADVRRFPGSRRHPHFGKDVMERSLPERSIEYRHFPGLGGRRKGRPDSPHRAWEVAGFRSYADHMESDEFAEALAELEEWALERPAAILCAEASPFRCHRRLVSDALLRDGFRVVHITGKARAKEHELTPFARIVDGRILYDVGTLDV